MKIQSFRLNHFFALVLFSVFMFSCEKEIVNEDRPDDSYSNSESFSLPSADLPGRNLAANCFQCHGTNGYAGKLKIAGESVSEIVSEMKEMKAKDPRANIMNVHARAYSDEEIKLIGEFFSKQ